MRIACFTDLRFTASATPTGVGKHIDQMVRGLAKKPDVQLSLAINGDQLTPAGTVPQDNALRDIPVHRLAGSHRAMKAVWTVLDWPKIDSSIGEADWVYCPSNEMVAVGKPRWAVTFHGVFQCDPLLGPPLDLRSKFDRRRWRYQYEQMVRRGDLLLVVSQFLKQQLVDMFGADERKIAVVGNGVEQNYFDSADQPTGGSGQPRDRPYVLCVGGLNYMDGADFLLPVARRMKENDPELRILIAGYDIEERYRPQAEAIGNIELLGYVPGVNLARLMRDAVALLYLSRYESFGIAGAEAMAAGTPVIGSNYTALPEIIGDGGAIFDPTQSEPIADLVVNLARTPSLHERYRTMGRQRAQRYTWQACVDRLYEAFRSAD